MVLAWRFVVVFAFALWQGGFLFYTTFVVPVGTEELGATDQGFITRRVTLALNVVGAVTLLLMACDHFACRARARWAIWAILALLQGGLFYLHSKMDALLDPASHDVATGFYGMHRVYLWASTLLWLFALAWLALALRAWNRPRVVG